MERKIVRSGQASMESSACNDKTIYVSCDNGVSGSFAWVNETGSESGVVSTPTFVEQDYVKKKQNVTRVDTNELYKLLYEIGRGDLGVGYSPKVRMILERPMIFPGRFRATMSAIRAWEATLIVLQKFSWPRLVVDSRHWQKVILPQGCHGPELKTASIQTGCRLFPDHIDWIKSQGDADSLLMAEVARRQRW